MAMNPETIFTKQVRLAVAKYLPGAVVHKHHGDEFAEKGVPDLFGEYNGTYIAWELKVHPGRPSIDQLTVLKRYKSPLAGVMYLRDGNCRFVPASALRERDFSYDLRNVVNASMHVHVPLVLSEPGPAGSQVLLPRLDKLVRFLMESSS